MRCFLIVIFIFISNVYCEKVELVPLLEQINKTTNSDEKNQLLEKLKKKLAQKNINAREEADAIIKAKEKIPLKTFDESLYDKVDIKNE